jgi:P4 family phage/plasmid primase-like protien
MKKQNQPPNPPPKNENGSPSREQRQARDFSTIKGNGAENEINSSLPSVSLFTHLDDKTPTTISLEEVMYMVANPSEKTRKLVEEIRAIEKKIKGIREEDEYWYECEGSAMVVELEARKKKVKRGLSYVTFGGVFLGGHQLAHLSTYSKILICDFDHLSHHKIDVEEFRGKVNQLPTTLFSFLSPSGDGCKVGVKVDAGDGDAATHKRFFEAVRMELWGKVGMMMDVKGKDVPRLCFLSHDPHLYFHPDSTPFTLPAIEEVAPPLPLPLLSSSSPSSVSPRVASDAGRRWKVEEVEVMMASITIPPHDHAKWISVCYSVSSIDHLPLDERVGLLERWSLRAGGDAERYSKEAGGYYHLITTQPAKSVTIASLVQMAKDGGWVYPTSAGKIGGGEYIDNDTGRADRWIDAHHQDVRWVVEMKAWMVWDGVVWREDGEKRVREMAKDDARLKMEEAKVTPGERERGRVMALAKKMGDSSAINSMLELANSDPKVVLRKEHLNANPYLLGVKNGVLDLKTSALRGGGRADLITKTAGVEFDVNATCPRWESFVDEVMGGDQTLIAYLQRLVGYGLTGEVTEHLFPFLYGGGKNGKSTFIETLLFLMGDYALKAQAELTMEDRRGGNAESIIAQLHGVRCVVGSEVDAGGKLAEGRLKNITGGDRMTGRALYGSPFSFTPTHLLWGFGNHKPVISGTDLGVWRRLKLIPFVVTIPEEKRDGRLGEKLRAEGSGILNWALKGLRNWEEIGMERDEPTPVKEAVKAYRTAEDELGGFIDAALEEVVGFEMSGAEVYRAYKLWAEEEGVRLLEKQGKLLNKLWDRGMNVKTGKAAMRFLLGWRVKRVM